jgi:plastocyanin
MKPLTKTLFALTGLLIALPASAREVKVSMSKLRFTPAAVQVATGDTVIWVNDDDRGHTVVADDGSFNSGEIGIGGVFRQQFSSPGEVAYHCDHHPRMRGKVVVAGKPQKDPPPKGKEPKGKEPKAKD